MDRPEWVWCEDAASCSSLQIFQRQNEPGHKPLDKLLPAYHDSRRLNHAIAELERLESTEKRRGLVACQFCKTKPTSPLNSELVLKFELLKPGSQSVQGGGSFAARLRQIIW